MRQCPACGAQVADNAPLCPQCGATLPVVTPQVASDKSKTTAAILALLLGGFGVHYFYLNKPIMGIICVALTLFTWVGGGFLGFIGFIALLVSDEKHFQDEWLNPEKKFPIW